MKLQDSRIRTARFGLALVSALAFGFVATPAFAQQQGECSGGNCGTPNNNGGGCGCGCGGSILVDYTDIGQSYEQSDDSDHDGIDDALDNCPYVANPDQADGDGDAIGDRCDNCAGTPNRDQKANSCGDLWAAKNVGFSTEMADNNVGQVIGAVCDMSCTAQASAATTVTVALDPTTANAPTTPGRSTAGSASSAGEVACSVQQVGGAGAPIALFFSTLGLALVGVVRRRRAR